jgi:hypothetical protein
MQLHQGQKELCCQLIKACTEVPEKKEKENRMVTPLPKGRNHRHSNAEFGIDYPLYFGLFFH